VKRIVSPGCWASDGLTRAQISVPFTEKNVGKDPQARQELMELGLLSLPVLLIGEQKLTGFNPTKIDEAIKTLNG